MVVSNISGLKAAKGDALANVNRHKTLTYIRAWEEREKAKSNNKFEKAFAKIEAWEAFKQAAVETSMRQAEQTLERRRASVLESKRNEIAEIRRSAFEKKARAQARRQEEFVAIEEESRQSQLQGRTPKSTYLLHCFGS